jgi:hypothetical protein
MICPQCGNDNPPKLKFCVNCGVNLENPQEVNYEQVDMGGYHTEEESGGGGFKLGSGTFTISDRPSRESSSDLYTAAELNEDEQEFDFSSIDEPFIPKLDTERVTLPQSGTPNGVYGNPQQPVMNGMPQFGAIPQIQGMQGMPAMQGIPQMQGMPQQGAAPQPGAVPQSGANPMGGMGMPVYGQPMMFAQPQIIGYDQNGMPIYGQAQPVMFAQPQIIGYDQNGMPVYGQAQPVMFAQPQIIGYDQNGMPVYGQVQPVMYAQPQTTNENGEPVQPQFQQPVMFGGMPAMNMPAMGTPQQQQQPKPQQQEDKDHVDVPDDFWEFFDGGKSTKHAESESSDDFFGKHSADTANSGSEIDRLKKFEKKRIDYMSDTPLVDADKLVPNTAAKFNKMYMRQTEVVNADDLAVNETARPREVMRATRDVDASMLNSYEHIRSRITMGSAGEADAGQLEAFVPRRNSPMMSGDVRAVEAMPKKKTTYNDEIDAIELPDYMQARKTAKDDQPEIPGLPEI